MSTTNAPASPDNFERDATPAEAVAESITVEDHAGTESLKTPRLTLDTKTLVPVGALVVIGLVLWQNPDVRRACNSVLQDPEVQKACRNAGREITTSWSRHGGSAAIASTLFR